MRCKGEPSASTTPAGHNRRESCYAVPSVALLRPAVLLLTEQVSAGGIRRYVRGYEPRPVERPRLAPRPQRGNVHSRRLPPPEACSTKAALQTAPNPVILSPSSILSHASRRRQLPRCDSRYEASEVTISWARGFRGPIRTTAHRCTASRWVRCPRCLIASFRLFQSVAEGVADGCGWRRWFGVNGRRVTYLWSAQMNHMTLRYPSNSSMRCKLNRQLLGGVVLLGGLTAGSRLG
jgi:hypothetical protein